MKARLPLGLLLALAATSHAGSIAIDFGVAVPYQTGMGLGEVAGVIPQANWNSFDGATGTGLPLINEAGVLSGATITWSANNIWGNQAADTAGDSRMMRGYIDTSDTSTTSVTLSDLPADFLLTGYNVFVYYDLDNFGGDERVGAYTIGSLTYYGRSASAVSYSGSYVQAQTTTEPIGARDNNLAGALAVPAGNYMVFEGLNTASFTLLAEPSVASQTFNRAGISGLQIVQVPEPSTGALFALACGWLGLRRRTAR